MKAIAALLVLVSAASSQAATLPSFEATLGQFRQNFLTQRAEQKKAKALQAGQDLDNLAFNADNLRTDSQRLRNAVNDLRWRCQRNRPDPRRPGGDPWLRNDLDRLVWSLRDHARYVQDLSWRAQNFLRDAKKDPEAVAPAQRLQNAAGWLRSEEGWLQMDAQNAGWEFRNAGFSMQAFDVENAARDAQNSAMDLENISTQILAKVRP